MANTPNLNLALPAHGSANWDAPLNSNFSLIDAGVVLNAPTADQTIAGGHDLNINNGGAFEVTNASATPSDASLSMAVNSSGQGGFSYNEGSVNSAALFNPNGGISLNPKTSGADGGANGVVINNSGLFLAGVYSNGNALTLGNGNLTINGGSLSTGNPVLNLGSSGVEGVIRTVPQLLGGSYTLRSPDSAINSVLSLPSGTGTMAVIVSAPATAASAGAPGQVAFDATHIYICIATNSWIRSAAAAW